MLSFVRKIVDRAVEWWTRSFWGWLVVLGPMACYFILLITLEFVGLGASDQFRYQTLPIDEAILANENIRISYVPIDPNEAFRPGEQLFFYGIGGRLEFALVSAIFFLVACFSIVWSLPRILFAIRNPFGGVTGLILSIGSSAFLFWLYLESDYNLRQIFADDILKLGEQTGRIEPIYVLFQPFGFDVLNTFVPPSVILEHTRDVVYAVGNAAPWCLIVLAAKCASYEPRSYRDESPESLRDRLWVLQIAVVLAAANIVLSIAFTRSMVSYPPMLLEPELAQDFAVATSRYTALWGALGTILLITALAPAAVSLNRQLDRVATRALGGESGRKVSHAERIAWRQKHGLLVSAQQAFTTGVAVIAPVMTSPTLDASQGINRDGPQGISPPGQELGIDQR